MSIKRAACLEPCPTERGELVGRDPRQMGRAELQAAGFEPMTPMEVVRAKCLDCCAGSAQEVRYCVAVNCPSWPYRLGSNPFRAPIGDERKAALRANASKGRAALAKSRREAVFTVSAPLGEADKVVGPPPVLKSPKEPP
jgi:hypothetical protein